MERTNIKEAKRIDDALKHLEYQLSDINTGFAILNLGWSTGTPEVDLKFCEDRKERIKEFIVKDLEKEIKELNIKLKAL